MTVNATEFKAKCLSLMERVKTTGDPVLITKHGKVIAQLAPPPTGIAKPWLALRGTGKIRGDIVSPAVRKEECDSASGSELKHRPTRVKR